MNWGKAIILVFVLFGGFIGTLVYRMTRQHVDLVSENYYQKEIDFQRHIDRVRNARQNHHPGEQAGLTSVTTMTYQADQQQIVVVLPSALRNGEITFYRPGDRQQDFRVNLAANYPTRQVVSTQALGRGNWRVQFTWSDGQREYYQEEQFFL